VFQSNIFVQDTSNLYLFNFRFIQSLGEKPPPFQQVQWILIITLQIDF